MSDQSPLASPIGREPQRAALREWVAGLAEGRGRAVLIEGEAGIGKSALVRTAMPEAAARRLPGLLGRLRRTQPGVPPAAACCRRSTPAATSARGKVAVSGLLRSEPLPGNRIDVIAAAAERLLGVVDELCADRPGDAGGRRHPMGRPRDGDDRRAARPRGRARCPLLLVATGRPVPKREDVVAAAARARPRLDRAAAQLHRRRGGRARRHARRRYARPPAARARRGRGRQPALPHRAGRGARPRRRARRRPAASSRPPRDATPGSLSAAITDRLEFLSPAAREVVRVAALLGLDFAVSELAVVSGRRLTDLLPILDEAILAGVVLENGAELDLPSPAHPGQPLRGHADRRAVRLAPRRGAGAHGRRRAARAGRPPAAARGRARRRRRRGRQVGVRVAGRDRAAARRPGAAGGHPAAAVGDERHPRRRRAARRPRVPARRRALPGRRAATPRPRWPPPRSATPPAPTCWSTCTGR